MFLDLAGLVSVVQLTGASAQLPAGSSSSAQQPQARSPVLYLQKVTVTGLKAMAGEWQPYLQWLEQG